MDEKDIYIKKLEDENALLKEEVNLLKLKLFGKSSERKKKPKDLEFNEAEKNDEASTSPTEVENTPPAIESKGRQKKINGAIPRRDKKNELTGDGLKCCHENPTLTIIGEKTRERLDYIPAKLVVNKYIEMTYKCSCCGKIVTATGPKKIIPKSDVDSGILTTLIVGKYEDHIPLYRHEEIFNRLGLELSRNTTSRWVIKVAEALTPLLNLMKEDLQKSNYVQCDETSVQVLHENGRSAESKSYMWVLRNATANKQMVIFNYEPSRSGATALNILEGIKGAIQTDGYAGYNGLGDNVLHLACWAHARRKFDEAVKTAINDKKKKKKDPKTLAEIGLQFITILYKIDNLSKKFPIDRQARIDKLLMKYKEWLIKSKEIVPPKTYTGKAISYTLGIWDKLCNAASSGQYHLDNNLCENAIRPFALGRRNWLFAATEKGADASATLYSLIQSAKINGLNPYDYIYHLIEEIPKATQLEDFEKLLPYNWKPDSTK